MTSQELKKTLWAAADKLRDQMDAAEYKHIVLGLIFLKYISDAFDERRKRLAEMLADPASDHYFSDNPAEQAAALEDRDYYNEANVFWVPPSARWESIRNQAKQPAIGSIVDKALEEIEDHNPTLKNILDKRFARTQFPEGRLGQLIDLISTIGFTDEDKAKDVLGEVYEYFLGQFATAEGKKGGQFYTPGSVVRVLVEVLAPHTGRVYDPCCGSGGMFVQSEKFVQAHGGRRDDIAIYGQESNPTTLRLAAMNLALRQLGFDLGKEPADSFGNDQHPDLKADYILANPPFNISDWGGEKFAQDKRWKYGTPPAANANYAWLQHILWHLKPSGQAGVVLANGSMSSNQSNEGNIRQAMVDADVVECMVALPPQLFLNTQIPACLWFLTHDKTAHGRDRRSEMLFIDARKLGQLETRVFRVFTDDDVQKIAGTVHRWRQDGECEGVYEDIPGFCRSVKKAEIKEHGYVVTPGRYVGAEEVEEDAEAFAEKMESLTAQLAEQMAKGTELDKLIREKLGCWDMASEWHETTLGEVVNLKRGFDLPSSQRVQGKHPIISSSGVTDYHAEAKVKAPGVVTGRYGTIGEVYFSEKDFWPLNTTLYVEDFKGNDPRFIYYFLKTFDYLQFSDKAAVPGINRNHLHQARVVIPDPAAQRKSQPISA